MLCQLCEEDQILKWKCLECALLMCHRCRENVHPKFDSSGDHTIIDVTDISESCDHVDFKPDLTNLKCKEHSGENCCFYCTTCESLVCETCIAKARTKHEFKEIVQEYVIKRERIMDEQKEIEKGMQALKSNEQTLKQVKSLEQLNYEKVKNEILDYENVLVDAIRRHSDTLFKELDEKWNVVSNYIDCKTKDLQEKLRQLKEQQTKISRLFHVENSEDLFSAPDSFFRSRKDTKPTKSAIKGVPQLTRGDISKILPALGRLDDVDFPINTELQLKAQFETELTEISSVIACPDDGLWICDRCSGITQKVEPIGGVLNVKSAIEVELFDGALLPSGDLLMSIVDSYNIKLIQHGQSSPPGIKDSVYTVSPLFPKALHATCDEKIIVGAIETSSPSTENGKVILMDQNGHQEKMIQYDNQNQPLFSVPVAITRSIQDNIAVVDMLTEDGRGRVVVLDQEGELRNIYTGHPDINNENYPFHPQGITTTPSDNFVVADTDNHTLHILNSEGEIITYYNTKEMGILLPLSLSVSSTGQLYIGSGTYKNSNQKAELSLIDNFLF